MTSPLLSKAQFVNASQRGWSVLPGVGLSALMALAATFVSGMHGGSPFLYALFFGIAYHYLSAEPRTQPGIEFSARALLRLGVGLLGARITIEQITALGWSTIAVVVAGVATTIGVALLLGRRLGLTSAQSVLSGGAVAICGASAALAISAVLPRNKDGDRFTIMVVIAVTVLSTIAMVAYPSIALWLGLPPAMAGLFLGGTIHDVAQVVGAGYTLGTETGDIATVVKLLRVALLTAVVIAVSASFKPSKPAGPVESTEPTEGGHGPERDRPAPLMPWFLWMFIAMVALNSMGAFSPSVQTALGDVSRALLTTAIAALGLKTSFKQLADTGWRPLTLIICATLWLAVLVLACIWWLSR